MKHTYHIESYQDGQWIKFIKDESRDFCLGWLSARKQYFPRLAIQVVRDDGKVIDYCAAHYEVGIGQVAGFPTAEQYERAGNDALKRAESIRQEKAKRNP